MLSHGVHFVDLAKDNTDVAPQANFGNEILGQQAGHRPGLNAVCLLSGQGFILQYSLHGTGYR